MADYDKSKFDPKAAAEARKAEMDEITGKLEKGVKEIFEGDNYKDYLKFCAKLPRYSVNNQILIMMQKPDAVMCQSFTGWKDMNRFVKKGEKGIRILAPSPYKMEKEQDKMDASGKPVFDCKFALWKENRYFDSLGKKLTKQIAEQLIKDGRANLKKCKSKKTGKTYDAILVLSTNENGQVNFTLEFPNTNGGK